MLIISSIFFFLQFNLYYVCCIVCLNIFHHFILYVCTIVYEDPTDKKASVYIDFAVFSWVV